VEEIPHSSADGTNITGRGGQARNLSHYKHFLKATSNSEKEGNMSGADKCLAL
jgi:hypothetical protein